MRFIYRLKQLMLLGGDFLAFVWGFYLAVTLRYWQLPDWSKIEQHLSPFFMLFLLWIVILFINGLYDLGQLKQKNHLRHFLEAALISLIFGVLFFYIFPQKNISPKTVLLLNVILGFSLSYFWRFIYNRYINVKTLQTNTIFVGLTDETKELINLLQNYPERGYQIVAIIDPENKINPENYPFVSVYNNLGDLSKIVQQHRGQLLVVAPHLKKDSSVLPLIYQLIFSKIKISDLTSFYEVITGRIPPSTFSEAWFLEHIKKQDTPIYDKFRIFLDKILGLVMLLFLIILYPFIALAIKLKSPGPIFFKQIRIGQNNHQFTMYKFRTMIDKSANNPKNELQLTQKNDTRIISLIGKFLRLTHLDELPQCLNLLKGDLTLIGPRPAMKEVAENIQEAMPFYALRHLVKPGLTGWAVIHQNYSSSLEEELKKLQYDLFYIKNKSFLLDLSIILRTINIIFRMMGQ